MSKRTRRSIGRAVGALVVPVLLGCGGGETPRVTGEADARPSSASRSTSPDRPTRAEIADMMAATRIPGLTLAELGDGEIVRVELIGVADAASGDPVTEATLFEAASLSKPVFATIVLRLAERGEIDLDRPLAEDLVNERLDDPRSDRLTARMVLSHRTGLPNWGGDRLELAFDPGTAFNYSGEGYVYLQRVVEHRTGLSLDEVARREIFDPLGMERSRFAWSEAESEALALAVPHDRAGRPQEKRQPLDGGNAAASLHTTAAEYAVFVRSWMGWGEPLLAPETRRAALSAPYPMEGTETATPKPPEVWRRIAWKQGWGFQLPRGGEMEATLGSGSATGAVRAVRVWHWGDNGPAKAFVGFDPVEGDGLVYFANSANGLAIGRALVAPVVGSMEPTFAWAGYEAHDAPGFGERLEGLVAAGDQRWDDAVEAFEAALEADPEDEVTARWVKWLRDIERVEAEPVVIAGETLESYAGTYGPRRLWVDDGRLHYQRGEGQVYELVPLTERLFALEGLASFRLEMVVDGAGRPIGLVGHYVEGQTDESPRDV
ncbi:MAG: serine hydrolase domain-containing protein [Thermoanaerobaculia bacterium]|nr:serine hydrolase domain-containing protein [Thermoanaerobaculia bacterium]